GGSKSNANRLPALPYLYRTSVLRSLDALAESSHVDRLSGSGYGVAGAFKSSALALLTFKVNLI
ncbi:unnamed protein product, partial [Ceratitis capitata]